MKVTLARGQMAAQRLWQAWSQFWFAPQDLFGLCLFRCLFAFMLLAMYGTRMWDIEVFFYNRGMLPVEQVSQFLQPSHAPVFFWFPGSDLLALIYHAGFLFLLLLMGLGLLPRFGIWLVLFLHLSFLQRNPAIIYGADLISTFWLYYLGFTQQNRYFNLANIWRRRSGAAESVDGAPDFLSSMGLRLIQLQLCIMYAYTGWEKLRGSQWWEGTALWTIMGNDQLVPVDLSFITHVPWVVAGMTFGTLIFEIYFPVMIWLKPLRKWWLALGFVMHMGAAIFMGLFYFSLVMLVAYLVFVEPEWLRRWIGEQFRFAGPLARVTTPLARATRD